MEELANGIFVETEYDGVNVGAIMDRQGFVCVDVPSYPRDARDWNNRLERRHPRGARFIVLTDSNGDRILNTRLFRAPILTQQFTAEKLFSFDRRYPQGLLDSLIQRNPGAGRELTHSPVDRPSLSFDNGMTIITEEREIRLIHVPGPTPGNAWLYIPDAGVLFTGDSVVADGIPPMTEMCLTDWMESLQTFSMSFERTVTVVPGRGPIGGQVIVDQLAGYFQDMQRQLKTYIEAGSSRDELAELVDEFLPPYLSTRQINSWQRYQLVIGLQRAYDWLIKHEPRSPNDWVKPALYE